MSFEESADEEGSLPCWYYEKSDLKRTPSLIDGVSQETESRYRREGPKFIFQMGTKLGLHYDTIATGVVYFHRFFMFHSFKKISRHVAATCCLFLAGKVEETPKKLRDLIKTAKMILPDIQFKHFGEDPREELLTMEKMLLHSIRFDFFVEHPYQYILKYANALKGDRQKIEKLVQMSWTFVNDSFSTCLCLLWEPQIIAVAVMFLAGRLCKFQPQDWAYHGGRWWEQFIPDITTDLLEDICHQILDQYSSANKNAPKPKKERAKTPSDKNTELINNLENRSEDSKSSLKVKKSNPISSKLPTASRIQTIVNNNLSLNDNILSHHPQDSLLPSERDFTPDMKVIKMKLEDKSNQQIKTIGSFTTPMHPSTVGSYIPETTSYATNITDPFQISFSEPIPNWNPFKPSSTFTNFPLPPHFPPPSLPINQSPHPPSFNPPPFVDFSSPPPPLPPLPLKTPASDSHLPSSSQPIFNRHPNPTTPTGLPCVRITGRPDQQNQFNWP